MAADLLAGMGMFETETGNCRLTVHHTYLTKARSQLGCSFVTAAMCGLVSILIICF